MPFFQRDNLPRNITTRIFSEPLSPHRPSGLRLCSFQLINCAHRLAPIIWILLRRDGRAQVAIESKYILAQRRGEVGKVAAREFIEQFGIRPISEPVLSGARRPPDVKVHVREIELSSARLAKQRTIMVKCCVEARDKHPLGLWCRRLEGERLKRPGFWND